MNKFSSQSTNVQTERETLSLSDADPLVRVRSGILTNQEDVVKGIQQLQENRPFLDLLNALEESGTLPLVTGSHLTDPIQLRIRIADDLSRLELQMLTTPASPDELKHDGLVEKLNAITLATVPNPTLLYSFDDIQRYSINSLAKEQLGQLYSLGRRITEYRGVSVTWDQSVDRKVWTTNIDTLNIIDALFDDGLFESSPITTAMEVGVGGGAISKTLLRYLPKLEHLMVTDISAYALMCAKRNLEPAQRKNQVIDYYLGKGIKDLEGLVDLIVVNPPYIPHKLRPDAVDPYRGTGLIREIIQIGKTKLSDSANARIYSGMSSLAESDLHEYLAEDPSMTYTKVGRQRLVPLKILSVSEDKQWISSLKRHHNLIDLEDGYPKIMERFGETKPQFRYWHSIFTAKFQRSVAI